MKFILALVCSLLFLAAFGQGLGADDTTSWASTPGGTVERAAPPMGASLITPLLSTHPRDGVTTSPASRAKRLSPWDSYPIYDLTTTDMRFFPYFVQFKRRVEGEWKYPIDSQIDEEMGDVTLIVALSKDGKLRDVTVESPSHYERLNSEAVRAVMFAEPFPPFPEEWGIEGIRIRASFSYVIEHWWNSDEKGEEGGMSASAPSFKEIRARILGNFEKHAVSNKTEF